MKKILFCLLVIAFTFSLSAEVYKSSVEIKAYKELEDATPPPQEQVTLTLLGPTEVQFADGFNIEIPAEDRNTAYTAFYWELSGNLYRGVTVSFSFSPMYLGVLNDYSSVNLNDSEKTSVIPYTVNLSHIQTQVTKDNTTRTIGLTKINSYDEDTAFDSGLKSGNSTVYINYADKIEGTLSGTVSTSSVSNLSIIYNLSTNSYATYGKKHNRFTGSITTCNDWVRRGKADVTLKIDQDGKWTAVDTSVLINGGTFKAFVTVSVSVN